jgi:hypothetical protein
MAVIVYNTLAVLSEATLNSADPFISRLNNEVVSLFCLCNDLNGLGHDWNT